MCFKTRHGSTYLLNPLSQTPSYLCKLDSSTPGEEVRSHTRECVRNLDLRVQARRLMHCAVILQTGNDDVIKARASLGAGASWRALGLKTAGAHSIRSLKISGCKRWCPKDLWVCAPAAPVLTHSLTDKHSFHFSTSNEMSLFYVKITANKFWNDDEMLLKLLWTSCLQMMD